MQNKKIDLKHIPLLTVLVLFIMTYFVYKDFDIRMLYGYAIIVGILFVHIVCTMYKSEFKVHCTLLEKIYLVIPIVVLLNLCRKDVVKDYELVTHMIAMIIATSYLLILKIQKNEEKIIFKIIVTGAMMFSVWEIIHFLIPAFTDIWLPYLSKSSQKYNTRMLEKGFAFSIGGSLTYVDYIMMMGIAVCISCYFKNRKKRELLKTLLFLFVMIIMGRRGELLSVILIFLILFLFFDSPQKRKKHIIIGVGVITTGIILFIVFMPVLKNVDFLYRYVLTFERIMSGEDFSSGRFELYSIAWSAFKRNPVFGIGWRNYRTLIPRDFKIEHGADVADVHNIYLQFLCETGILGAIFIIGGLITIYFLTFHMMKRVKNLSAKEMLENKKIELQQLLIFSFFIQSFFVFTGILDPVFSKLIFWFFYVLSVTFASHVYRELKNSNIKIFLVKKEEGNEKQ